MKLAQLSLRDLFWLIALVAMGCGWWVDRARIADAVRAAEARERAAQDSQAEWKAEAKVLEREISMVQQLKERLQTNPISSSP